MVPPGSVNRSAQAVGLEARVKRIRQEIGAVVISLMAVLAIGTLTTHAESPPPQPTITVTPASPTPTLARNSWTWRARSAAITTANPTTCATAVNAPTTDCPVTMKLVATNLSAATSTFRVGDVVQVEVALTTTRTLDINAIQAYADFPASDLQLITGPSDPTPLIAGDPASRPVSAASGAFGVNATVLRNSFTQAGSGATVVSQVNVDAGVNLPDPGTPSTPVTLSPGTPTPLGRFFVRVLRNDTTSIDISLRDSSGDDGRFSMVALVDADDAGINVLGPVQKATINVATTATGVALIPATPPAGTVRRIGDVIPVRVTLNPTTILRNARTVRTVLSFDPAKLGLVTGPPINGSAPPPFVATGTFTPDLTDSILGTPQMATTSASYMEAVSGTTVTGTIDLTVSGRRLDLTPASGPATVATIYLRILAPGDTSVTLNGAEVGESPSGNIVPTPVRTRTNGSPLAFAVTTQTASPATIAGARGTLGIGLSVASPLVVDPSGALPTLAVGTSGTASQTFTVTDGRYLDVEVTLLAGTADVQQADRFAINLSLPAGITLPANTATSTFRALGPGIVLDNEPSITTTSNGTGSTVHASLKTASGARLSTATPLVRLRLAVAPTATGATATSTFAIAVATSTFLTQTGTRFAANLHDDGDPLTATPTLDHLPRLIRQMPASLTFATRLQGRTANDPDARFMQPVSIALHLPGQATPATRLATAQVPETLLREGTSPAATMRYRASSVRQSGVTDPNATVTLTDLDPGTYDVLLKGDTSLTIRARSVTLLPGPNTAAAGTVTLLEGDANDDDRINIVDFAALSSTYATKVTPSVDGTDVSADFNRSGYIDAFDFSLLARNYAVSGPVNLATVQVDPALPPMTTTGTPTTHAVGLAIPAGDRLKSARIIVTGDTLLRATCPATAQPTGATCTPDGTSRVILDVADPPGTTGTVPVGGFTLVPVAPGTATVSITVVSATGIDSATTPATITYRAPTTTALVTVDPDATFLVTTAPNGPGITATINLTVRGAHHVTGGTTRLDYDAGHLEPNGPCDVSATPGITCIETASGTFTFTIGPDANLTGTTPIGFVALIPISGTNGAGVIRASVTNLTDATDTQYDPIRLTAAPAIAGNDTASYVIDAGTFVANRVQIASIGTRSIRTRTANPGNGLWVSAPAGTYGPGSIVPVQVGITTDSRPVDAAQVVLQAASGFTLVDANGNPATGQTAMQPGISSALPVILRQVVDQARTLLELAFGRQMGPAITGVTGQGTLGTVYLRVGDSAVTGEALRIVPAGTGSFTTTVTADGESLATSLGTLTLTVDPILPASNASSGSSPDPATVPAPFVGDPANGTVVIDAPVIGGTPARSALAPSSTVSGPRASLPAPSSMSRAISEDSVRGILSLSIPGRAPVELRTGLATSVPDAYCPTVRHNTYIRLEDVGIAGATFGVEPGGVLSWVTPDQAGCVNWSAISEGGLTFTKETIMQFQLARAVPGALLWVLSGDRNGELYEVDPNGIATYITGENFAANQDHFRQVWANVIPVSTSQVDGLASRGAAAR